MRVVIVSHQDLSRVQLFDWVSGEDCRGIWRVWTMEAGVPLSLEQFLIGSVGPCVDHRNGDDFNFCRDNLEEVSLAELVDRRVRRATGISIEASNESPF